MKVAILNDSQKQLLTKQEYKKDSLFNPIQDLNDNWIISLEEVNMCENEDFFWVKTLNLIDFKPKIFKLS